MALKTKIVGLFLTMSWLSMAWANQPVFQNLSYPFRFDWIGPFGIRVPVTFQSLQDTYDLKPSIIYDKNPRPKRLYAMPALCPRVFETTEGYLYKTQTDVLNQFPLLSLLDSDRKSADANYSEFDGKNVLMIKKVTIRNDYEDDRILDYSGPNPLTGKHQVLYEGQGGFYANFHYAIVPYDAQILKMNRQTLLHLAQGRLHEINMEGFRPKRRTHSFIPGPFVSNKDSYYPMCEWGDTQEQAPLQELLYQDFAIWDWDYKVENAHRLLLIVWEGDEEDWMIQEKLLDPFYMTDDLVGIFQIRRNQTLKNPLRFINAAGDFEITVQTGNLEFPFL